MNETMTLGEYVREAEVFRYSKEYFDLIKEANEVELMGIYLAANDFLVENSYTDNKTLIYVREMFAEAADTASGKPLPVEKATAVKKSFIKKVWNGIVKVLKILVSPFKAMARVIKTSYDKWNEKVQRERICEGLEKLINAIEETDDQDKILEFIDLMEEEVKKSPQGEAAFNKYKERFDRVITAKAEKNKETKRAMRHAEIINSKIKDNKDLDKLLIIMTWLTLSDSIEVSGFTEVLMDAKVEFNNSISAIRNCIISRGKSNRDISGRFDNINERLKEGLRKIPVIKDKDELEKLGKELENISHIIESTIEAIVSTRTGYEAKDVEQWFDNILKSLARLSVTVKEGSTSVISLTNSSLKDKIFAAMFLLGIIGGGLKIFIKVTESANPPVMKPFKF